MDDIPIFSGEKKDLDSWVTCGQFISAIENFVNSSNFTELEVKEFCQSKLSDTALEFFQKNFEKPWSELKSILFQQFPVKLTIREKVEVRKGLQQMDTESIDDFYQRCLQAQYFVADDVREVGFEREVLLHFLIGLSPLIRDLVLASKCSSSDDFINEARKYTHVIKEEVVVPDVNVKIEADLHYEEFEYKSQYDAYGNYVVSEDVFEEEENIKKQSKAEMDYDPQMTTKSVVTRDHSGKFKCNFCGKNFTTKPSLKDHVICFHTDSKRVSCIDCGKTFKNEVTLRTHIQVKHHGRITKWKCERCCGIFSSIYKVSHSKRVHKQCKDCDKSYVERHKHYKRWHSNSYNCDICNITIKSKELLLDHQKKVHGDLKQTCEFCNDVFFAKEECIRMKFLALHIANKHCTKSPENRVVCCYCNTYTARTTSNLGYDHILPYHFNQFLYPCNQCGKQIKTKEELKSHIKYKHTTEKLFQCEKCARNFKTDGLLKSHAKRVHEEHEKATCKLCNKILKNSHTLKQHMATIHSDAERTKYMCDDCGKSLTSKLALQYHKLQHLSESEKEQLKLLENELPKISCPHPGCDYTTIKKALMHSHNRRMHEKKLDFECPHCLKRFYAKNILTEHINGVHLNLKPFQCDNCEFATARKAALTEHNKVAHGNQRYDCPYCNHVARYKGNLDKHINNVHKNLLTNLAEKDLL